MHRLMMQLSIDPMRKASTGEDDAQSPDSENKYRKTVLQALERAEETEKPPLADLFTDVYDQIPSNLQEQERFIRDAINKRPNEYSTNIPL
uniref:Dehydrogenase E1 component domain-containing protein n=1 Tax=Solanum lycopersicum TaxID=4081 RepID=A0A3Q7JA20_SOLLC